EKNSHRFHRSSCGPSHSAVPIQPSKKPVKATRSTTLLLAAGAIIAVVMIANLRLGGETPPTHAASGPAPASSPVSGPTPPSPALSELADAPDWTRLEPWQETIDRETFVREM